MRKKADNGVQEQEGQEEEIIPYQEPTHEYAKVEIEAIIPYLYKKIVYTGSDPVGRTPNINKYLYPKGVPVVVEEKEAKKILSRFGDCFKEYK